MKDTVLVSIERISHAILLLRGHGVLLDADLAALYGVATKVLLQAVNATWSASRRISCCSSPPRSGRL